MIIYISPVIVHHSVFSANIESMVKFSDNLKLVYSISIANLHRSTEG